MKKALHIVKFPAELHAKLKAKAAILQIPLRELIIETLTDSVEPNKTDKFSDYCVCDQNCFSYQESPIGRICINCGKVRKQPKE